MAAPAGYRIETMPLAEVETTVDWAAREGWNPGLNDAACFHAIDPNGFLMGVYEGRPVARVAMPIYDDRFAFCGLYIVDPAFRGRGFGLALTEAGLAYIGDRNVGLDGVEAMAGKYRRLGYRTAHRSTRYIYQPTTEQTVPAGIVPLSEVPFAGLAAYDRRRFFAAREAFLRKWITQPGAAAFGFVEAGALKGYGVLRKCRVGYKIGPLFADGPDIASALFAALSNCAVGAPVAMDIPEPNRAALQLAARHGMQGDLTCERMYLKGDPGLPLDNIYGMTTFEAG